MMEDFGNDESLGTEDLDEFGSPWFDQLGSPGLIDMEDISSPKLEDKEDLSVMERQSCRECGYQGPGGVGLPVENLGQHMARMHKGRASVTYASNMFGRHFEVIKKT